MEGWRLGPICIEGQVYSLGLRMSVSGLAGHSRGGGMGCQSHRKDAGGWEDGKGVSKKDFGEVCQIPDLQGVGGKCAKIEELSGTSGVIPDK